MRSANRALIENRFWGLAVHFLKSVVAALAAFSAVPASATVIDATSIGYEGNYYGGIGYAPAAFEEIGPAGRFVFSGTDINTNAAFNAYTFCANIFRGVGAGLFAIMPLSELTSDVVKQSQLAALLTHADAEISPFVPYSDEAIAASASLQLAIWEVIYEAGSVGYDVSSGDFYTFGTPGTLTYFEPLWGRANHYLANVTNGTWTASPSQASYLFSDANQSQLFASPGVPEPATWLTLVLGFLGVGIGSRASRPTRAAKTA